MDYLDLLQWPAMVCTLVSAWLVASQRRGRRNAGFCLFLVSNGLWITWGWHDRAWALVILQACLAVLNLRGVLKNDPQADAAEPPPAPALGGERGA
jgi:sugar phosphate permease